MIVKIFTNSPKLEIKKLYTKDQQEMVIGVDKAAYNLIEAGISVDLAIGDFDSVTEKELQRIEKEAKKIIYLNVDKDYTDTFEAIKYVKENVEYSQVKIYANTSGRFDHFYGLIAELKEKIKIIDTNNILYVIEKANERHVIKPLKKYISFFAIEEVESLNLNGFKYHLRDYHLKTNDPRCLSNEGNGEVFFSNGKLLVIESDDLVE